MSNNNNVESHIITIPGTDVELPIVMRTRPHMVTKKETSTDKDGKTVEKKRRVSEEFQVVEADFTQPGTFDKLLKHVTQNSDEWVHMIFGDLFSEASRETLKPGDTAEETEFNADLWIQKVGESLAARSKKPSLSQLKEDYASVLQTYSFLNLGWSQRIDKPEQYKEYAAQFDCLNGEDEPNPGEVNEPKVLTMMASSVRRFTDLLPKIEELEERKAEKAARKEKTEEAAAEPAAN